MEFFRRKNLGKAALIAPFAIFPATFVFMTLSWGMNLLSGEAEWRDFGRVLPALALTAIGLFYSVLAVLILALPAYFILGKLKFLNIFSLCAVALIPATAGVLQGGTLREVVFVIYFSLWVAVTFWWLAPIRK